MINHHTDSLRVKVAELFNRANNAKSAGRSDNITGMLALIQAEKVKELEKYNQFLQKNGYTDSDINLEKPTAIERFNSIIGSK